MPRRSRTTTPQQPMPHPSRAQASSVPLVVGIPAEHLNAYSERQQQEIAKAQTCYLLRQQRLDPRIPAYYNNEPIDAERLDDAVRILMGLYDAKAMPEVTLEGALGFASLLATVAFEAEERRQRPALPMPYRYLVRRELDALDALYGADDVQALEPRAPRRRHKQKTQTTEVEVSHERQTRRRTTARHTTKQAQQTQPDTAPALPVVRKGGRKAVAIATHDGAHLSKALRAVAR